MNRYQNIPIIRNSEGTRYYKDNKYPRVPLSVNDIYVITTIGDRFDLLALQYYGDSSLWWAISIANENLPQDSLYIVEGSQIRIPANVTNIISNYTFINQQ
jgi:hypothetical protein